MQFKVISVMLILTALLSVNIVFAASQAPQLEWSKTYYGDTGRAIQTSDGGYAIAGKNASYLQYGAAMRAPTMIKTDAMGTVQWNKTFEFTGLEAVSSIIQTKDGGYVLSGSNVTAHSVLDITYSGWVIKIDQQGNVEWSKTIELPLTSCNIIQASDESYVLTGQLSSTVNGIEAALAKLDKNGNMLWSKTFSASFKVLATALVEADDGSYVIAGAWDSEGWLMKTDSDGNILWNQTYSLDGAGNYFFSDLVQSSDGGYVLAGGRMDKACLVKTDSLGNMEWKSIYSAEGALGFRSVAQTSGGYIAVTSNDKQAWIVKADASGNMVYDAKYGDVGENIGSFASSVVATDDGGFAVSGALNGYYPTTAEGFQNAPQTGNNVWLAKFAPESSTNPSPTVPEFPTWIVLPLALMTALITIIAARKKKQKQSS